VMAFGSGALIAALALELASEAHEKGGFLALAAGFLGGGILYWSLNHVIESKGGFLRKRATRRRFILRHKEKQAKALTEQQDQRHLLRHLPRPLTARLANHVQPRHYEPGDFIFKAGEKGDALFVINQGEVRLVGGANTAAEAAVDISSSFKYLAGISKPLFLANKMASRITASSVSAKSNSLISLAAMFAFSPQKPSNSIPFLLCSGSVSFSSGRRASAASLPPYWVTIILKVFSAL